MRLAGIDGCKAGWIAAVTEQGKPALARLCLAEDLAGFLAAQDLDLAVIDMPIGFVSAPARRGVETEIRGMLKGKASSVFNAPSREALAQPDYAIASQVNQRHLGVKLSKQSFHLFDKMREVDQVVRHFGQNRLREGHPELSFALMNSRRPVLSKKRDAAGAAEREALLAAQGFDLARITAEPRPKGCGRDDVLDAVALLWTALRVFAQKHLRLPPLPHRDAVGLEMSVVA